MTDEKHLFITDSRDRKNIARSARNKRTHNGKGGTVKFPSDFMTRKEKEAMNGECKTYKLNEPMSWNEFKAMPKDIQVSYITSIREKFNAPDKFIADMLGIGAKTLSCYLVDLKLGLGRGCGARKWNKEAFLAWSHGADPDAVKETEESVIEDINGCDIEPEAREIHTKCAVPDVGTMDFDCPATQALETLNRLLGESRIKLRVTWTVVKEAP